MCTHGYFWISWDLGVLSCGMTNSGFLTLGIRMYHSWPSWGAIWTPVQRMKWCVFARHKTNTQWLIFIHSIIKIKLCVCLPDLLTWILLRNDSFDAESYLVFGCRQIHRYDISSHDTILESYYGIWKSSPRLEEDSSSVWRGNVTEAYLKGKSEGGFFHWFQWPYNEIIICYIYICIHIYIYPMAGRLELDNP